MVTFPSVIRKPCARGLLKLRFKLLLSLKPRMIWAVGFVIWERGGMPEVFHITIC